jgi:iron complex outermembrane receptor protein
VSHFDLAGAERVEVLRGPFSVLYGNSSGGVIALFGARSARRGRAGVDLGSFGLRQLRRAWPRRWAAGFDLRAGVSQMEIDGFRPQSARAAHLANVRLGWQGDNDRVTCCSTT